MNKLLALLLSLLLAVGSPAGTLAEATASEPAIQEDGVIENEGVLPPEETVPPEEVTLPNESGDTPEDDGVLPQESDQEELDGDALPDEESSESLPDDGGFVWDEAHPLKSAVEIFGSVYALTVTETPVYSAADMTDTIFTVFSGCVLLATGYDEEQAAVEVWLIAETGETLNGYVYENALSQTVMTYEDALTTSDELRSFSVPTDAGELPVFVVMGTKPEDSIAQPDEQGDSVTDGFSGNPPQNDEPEETPPPELAVIPDSSETPADTATLFVPVTTPEETSPAPTATPALDDESALLLDGEDLLNDYGIMPINAPYPSGAYLGASVQVTTNKKYHNTVPDIVLLGDDEQNCDIHKTSDGGYVYCLENNKDSPGNESSGEYESYEVMDWLTYSQRATGHHSLWSASTWHALAAVAHKGYHHGTVITGSSKQAEGNTATAKDLYNFGGTQIAMRCVTNEIEGDGSTRGWDIDNISSNYRNGGPSNADDDIASLYADALMYVREFLYEGSYSYHFDITISGNVVSGPTRRSDGNYDVTISLTPSHSYQYDYGISADHVVSVNGRSYADEDNWYHVNSTSSTGATQVNLVVDTLPCTISFGTLGSSSYEDGFYIGVPRDNYNAQAVMILISSGPVVIGGAGSINLETPSGSINVTKQSAGGALLPGATFELLSSGGGVLQSQTTDGSGSVTFSDLDPGSYTVKEKGAPEGYRVAVPDTQGATVTAGQTSNLTFRNDEKTAKIKIVKTDRISHAPLAGAQFTVTRLSGPAGYTGGVQTVATLTTGPDGTAETDWLGYGRYRVEETAAPENYVSSHFSQEIDAFEDGKTYTFSVENEPLMGYIRLTKTDRLDQTPIEGVQFDIFFGDENGGDLAGTMTTGADGTAISGPLRKGKYLVKEHADPEGYVAELVTQDAVVNPGETTMLHADNQPIQGKIRIVKKDQLTKEALAGAEFTVTRISGLPSHKGAGDGETVAIVTTGADGIAETPLLTYGKYRVTETKVPEHFVDNAFSTEVFVKDDNMQTYEIEAENEPTKGYIRLTKSDSLDQTPIEGVQFDIFDSNGEQVGSMTTDEDGVATSEPLTKGEYTVTEHADPEGYVAELVTQDAIVKSDETTTLHADNQPIQGKIRIIKKDQLTKEALAGAEFTVTRIEGLPSHKGAGDGETVAVVTTGADGIAETPLLTYGKYRVTETKVPEHFVDNAFSTEVEIREDNLKTYEIEVENEPTKGYIQLTKSDDLDQTPIEGVQFDIYYNDQYGEGLAGTMVTDADGVATSGPLRKGKYIVKEHADPEGYVAELVTQDAVVKSDETTMLHAGNQPIQGKIRIIKKDQLTKEALAGAEFTVTRIEGLPSHKGVGNGETVAIVTTGADGIAETPFLTYGKYRVTETKVPEHFVDNSFSTEVEIREDNLKTYEIEVENEPTKGWLRLTKRDWQNGNPIEGVQFDIYYNDQYGEGLAGTMTTGADGVATSEPLRKGKYLVREHGATPGYLFEEIELQASIRSDEITELEATNRHVTVKLRLLKRDADEYAGDSGNTSTRGDGVLSGAEFQVLAGEDILDRQGNVVFTKGAVVVESLKTEGDVASVTTDELWPGLYEIVELSPPTGYQPSSEHIFVDARDAAGQSAEAVVTYEGVKTNEIKLGAKAIVKTLGTDQGEVGDGRLETPEAGAEFDVYLKKAGSYEDAREFERDHLVTDNNGYAMTKPLPYGVYTLRQTKGEAGYEIKAPIDFFIDGTENLVNPPVMSLSDRPILYRIKLVKQDAETGNTVPLAGASFKLRDGNGEYVTQTVFYPREQQIDTFTTDETGSVTLPETVRWGAYSIEEVHAPEGYLLPDAETSIFVGRDGDTPDEVYELEYTVQDAPVKGRLVLEKRGKQLSGFEEVEDAYGNILYHPVFEDGYLAGATFELRAAEDIRGGDGTLWFSAGELADTLVTTADGPVESKALPLGRYTLTEISSPDGYTLAEAPQEIELAYADDQTPLVEVRATVRNEYMPVEVGLQKVAETLETFADGNTVRETVSRAPGKGFVFGLFADQDFRYGGGILYADTLVATGATGADGMLTFSGHYPHGRYYVKELSAPDGWKVNPEKFPVSLTPDLANEDGVIRATLPEPVFDELVYSRITLTKEDITGEHTLPDTMIELRDKNDRVIWRDYTDENGNLPDIPVTPGRYTFREVLAPNGYELNVAEMTFTVDERGGVTGDTVVRDDYTRFFLLKQGESGEPLAGVEFGLCKEDGTLLLSAVTDENGRAMFEKVPYGDYTIVETKPLPGYLKSGTQVHLTVDGRFINPSQPVAVVTNEKLRMRGKKVDTSGDPLAGAEFALIDTDGYVIQSAVSDENGEFVFEGIPYGDWVIRETIAPEGFSRMDDRLLHVDESWTEPEQIFTFVDIPDHYEFAKVDGHNDPLPGVKFALEDAEGNVLRELVSGEDGIVHVTGLTPGTYTICETEALEGYTLTDETIELTIDERYIAPEKLKRIKNYSDIQTGVDFPITPLTVAGAGMLASAALLAVAYRIETREKRRHSRRK